jgi:tRNA-splicing ligase RtcB
MRLVEGSRIPIRLFARRIDAGALAQLRAVADLPFTVEAVAAMPDVHLAHGVAVGTVFATEDVVVPGALGGDLGCGISAARIEGFAIGLDRAALVRIVDRLAAAVPVGDACQWRPSPLPEILRAPLSTRALERSRDHLAPRHLGTLGGGNHFLELDRDADGDLWILVHSGSRGVGAAIAEHHRSIAGGPLAPVAVDDGGGAYLDDLAFARAFAAANRKAILARALEIVGLPASGPVIDVDHNHVEREIHGGRSLLVHRKGAIAAEEGALALIPGSMGTASYVVEGRGDPHAFRSASHGAGRTHSRAASRRFRRDEVLSSVRHVVHRVAGDLREEAPRAYREITEVLEDQRDLVTPLVRLEPLAVLKG